MAIIVNTGLDEDGANSFIEIAEATLYHASRGNVTWPLPLYSELAREQALIRSYDYLQTLRWKTGVFDLGIPAPIKSAQAECALRELVDPGCLMPDLTKDDFVTKKVIDVIETTYAGDARNVFSKVMALLKPYLAVSRRRMLVRG